MRRGSQSGFTLTELMVVIAMIAILTTIAFTVSGDAPAGAQGFADQAQGEIETARLRALSTRKWHRITVDAETMTLEAATTTGMATPAAYEYIGSITAPGNVRIVAMSTSTQVSAGAQPADGAGFNEEITFAPDGSSVGRTLWISDKRDRAPYRIALFGATGRARIYQGW